MNPTGSYTLRARYVFPVASPPIAGGTVTIAQQRIVAVGPVPDASEVEDLGNVAILPGLVNAHTHLEFSDLTSPIGEPRMGLVAWIRRVIAYRREAMPVGGGAVAMGLQQSVRLGTTTLAEIAQPGWPAQALDKPACEATVLMELIAPRVERVAAAIELARQHLTAAAGQTLWRPGLSPHAPYSAHPELLRQVVALSATHHVPVAFHLAESHEEMELLETGGGPFEDLLVSLGAWDPTAFWPGMTSLDYLHILARAERALVIHGNYLGDDEIAMLAENRDRMAVVYCPRTHAWFGHKPYPLEKLLAAGALVALGTDSRASSPDLSLLAEMRTVAQRHPAVRRDAVLQLGTRGGARALGRERIGSLEPGHWANLAVVALPERDAADPHDLLFDSNRPVLRTYVRGTLVSPASHP